MASLRKCRGVTGPGVFESPSAELPDKNNRFRKDLNKHPLSELRTSSKNNYSTPMTRSMRKGTANMNDAALLLDVSTLSHPRRSRSSAFRVGAAAAIAVLLVLMVFVGSVATLRGLKREAVES